MSVVIGFPGFERLIFVAYVSLKSAKNELIQFSALLKDTHMDRAGSKAVTFQSEVHPPTCPSIKTYLD